MQSEAHRRKDTSSSINYEPSSNISSGYASGTRTPSITPSKFIPKNVLPHIVLGGGIIMV